MKVFRSILLLVMLLLLAGGTARADGGRACGGRTVSGNEACCISGTVTLKGEPVEGAVVTVTLAGGKMALTDVTEWVENDRAPTFGFSLHEEPLRVRPGDTLVISVSYRGQERQLDYTALRNEQRLEIALDK